MDKTHKFAGPKAVIAMGNQLNQVCSTANDGTARYQVGWSDERVTEFITNNGFPEIDLGHVKRLRRTLFGPLFITGNGPSKVSSSKKKIAIFEKDLTDVMSYLTSKNPNWRTQI